MAFSTGYQADPQKVGAGERFGSLNMVFTATVFEDNLKVGRFAKLDTGSLDNLDGSATPVLAGVPLRNVASPVEDGGVIDADLYGQCEYLRAGLVTVDVKAGETPAQFGAVFASNAGDADDGKALAVKGANGLDTTGEFIREVSADVWLVRLV